MFHGGNNIMEGGYTFSPAPSPGYSFSTSPIGYMGPPPPQQQLTPYPTTQTIYSPVFYLSSLNSPIQQPIGTTGNESTSKSNDINNLKQQNSTGTSSPNSIPSFGETSTIITPPPTKENEFKNDKVKEIDKNSKKVIDETSSTLLLTDRFAVKLEPNKFINGIPATKWYTLSDEEREEVLRTQRRKILYKTALCVKYRIEGTCPFGDKCCFAHGLKELKPPPVKHPKYKTQLCDKFSTTGICPYGSRCSFIHATKGGEIVSDYREYLNCKEGDGDIYEVDSDEEEERNFAVTMNSIPKRYHQMGNEKVDMNNGDKVMENNCKPQQVINFSKSYGTPIIKTLFEKGRILKDNENVRKVININGVVDNLPEAPSSSYSCSGSEMKENDISGKSILEKLFKECHISDDTKKEVHIKKEENEAEKVNFFPNFQIHKNDYLEKKPFYNRNTGYYSQSKLPTFPKNDNT